MISKRQAIFDILKIVYSNIFFNLSDEDKFNTLNSLLIKLSDVEKLELLKELKDYKLHGLTRQQYKKICSFIELCKYKKKLFNNLNRLTKTIKSIGDYNISFNGQFILVVINVLLTDETPLQLKHNVNTIKSELFKGWLWDYLLYIQFNCKIKDKWILSNEWEAYRK